MFRTLINLVSTLLLLTACGDSVVSGQDALAMQGNAPGQFIRGVDVSSLTKVEDRGVAFFDKGKQKDPLTILRSHGANLVRLRAFVDPKDLGGYNDTADTVALAQRAKRAGMDLLLDLHYSDFWADPGKQYKPTAWENLSTDELVEAVYDYTHDILTTMLEANVAPDTIQIGNEIQSGLLWPDGKTWGDGSGGFPVTARLLNAGIRATRDVLGDNVEIVLHLADGGDNGLYRWWFDEITKNGVTDFDIIGLSYYPYWHGTLEDLAYNMNDISQRYDKDVLVVESAYGFTLKSFDSLPNTFGQEQANTAGYEASPAGQAAFLGDLTEVILNVENGRGRGFVYWEPTWLAVPFDTLEESTGWCFDEGYGLLRTRIPRQRLGESSAVRLRRQRLRVARGFQNFIRRQTQVKRKERTPHETLFTNPTPCSARASPSRSPSGRTSRTRV